MLDTLREITWKHNILEDVPKLCLAWLEMVGFVSSGAGQKIPSGFEVQRELR